ncbi:MAG: CYTH domain-containing protein [Muribaculaceae bacterium]|jgi:adenylate cyclase|nr:CYTH domain-containing protein [Muribaculaceae bacterium]MEE1337841.1 CYTH domain-containing protein [Muribaculaceae bacterium]
MPKEIEHKYLVINNSFKEYATKSIAIYQGYLSKDKERTVRVRTANDLAFITVKGKNIGDTRLEFEYPIPFDEASTLLKQLCITPIIEKTRYIVEYNGNTWEIDEFKGALEGLILAEIEIPSSEYKYDIPPFIGKNVTNDVRYYNSNLIDKIPE